MTKNERNTVYRIVLEKVKDGFIDKSNERRGLCFFLSLVSIELNISNSFVEYYEDIDTIFPEIAKHRPKRFKETESSERWSYWFPLNEEGNEKRLAILKQAFEETSDAPEEHILIEEDLSDINLDEPDDE